MKNIEKIKEDLINFGIKHDACEEILNSIGGNSLTELFGNINKYIYWFKDSNEKTIEFNSIFGNDLVIEDAVLLCCCSNEKIITNTNFSTNFINTIDSNSFRNCKELTSIEIPGSVTSIGDYAFYNCSGLTSVIIPNSIITIRKWVFGYCTELTSVTIPDCITLIEQHAFAYCNPELEIIIKY